MEFIGQGSDKRVVFTDVNELQAVGLIIAAMHRYLASDDEISVEALQQINDTQSAIEDSVAVSSNVRIGSRIDGDIRYRFGQPFLGCIEIAIAVFEQSEGTLESHMSEDEIAHARIYFPPVTV